MQQYNSDRDFAYGQWIDEINDQTSDFDTAVGLAQLAAEYGDYRGLEDLGIQIPQLTAGGGYEGGSTDTGTEPEEESADEVELTASQSAANANQLYNTISRIPGLTEENKVMMVRDAYNNGQISLDDQNRLIRQLGYAS